MSILRPVIGRSLPSSHWLTRLPLTWVAIITSASSRTNTVIFFKSKNLNLMLQSRTLPGVPMIMWSSSLDPRAISSPLTANLIVRSGQNWLILLATSPIWSANSKVGDRQRTCVCLREVFTLLSMASTNAAVLPVPKQRCKRFFRDTQKCGLWLNCLQLRGYP